MHQELTCRAIVPGIAAGPLIHADTGLSFMGGVDAASGKVIDSHHPLHGKDLSGSILALPSGRGSCSGSLVIFELLMNGNSPKALIFQHRETILTFGVLLAEELFKRGIPVVSVSEADFARLAGAPHVKVDGENLTLSDTAFLEVAHRVDLPSLDASEMVITEADQECLDGGDSEARRIALRLILRTAQLEGANSLIDVDMAHIDGCFYQGPAGLDFVRKMIELGAKVKIPTTMNALCVDRRTWRQSGVDTVIGEASDELADAYLRMGVRSSYTCAPYLLKGAPKLGQQIAWGESNAVVFANSVLGARTLKYPDYLDFLVSLTGRAPNADCHVPERRHATLRLDVETPPAIDDAYFACLGYHLGKISPHDIPVITGLEGLPVTHDHLKTFGAAFATTSAAPMFHIVGITPEAPTVAAATGSAETRQVVVSIASLGETYAELNTAMSAKPDLIALGNPHFSLSEIAMLASLCRGRKKAEGLSMVITCGREVFEQAEAAGDAADVRAFGGTFVNDTCWCLIAGPVVGRSVRTIATNSGKYAHYGAALEDKSFHLASLERCVEAACSGAIDTTRPKWLSAEH